MTKTHKLTNAQTRQMSAEYNALFERALAQLAQHRQFLHERLLDLDFDAWDGVCPHGITTTAYRVIIFSAVQALTLGEVRMENAKTADGKPTVSVVYEYPDELYTFLTHPATPEVLRQTLTTGVLMDDAQLMLPVQEV